MIKQNSIIHRFLFPRLNRKFFLRLALISVGTYLFFGFICLPFLIRGRSMEPNYHHGSIFFGLRIRYWFSPPQAGDVVMIRFSGKTIVLLKRMVATEGQTVEFKAGKLYINKEEQTEPYVKYPCNWELPPRIVKRGHVYVVGDNRNVPMDNHSFGQVSLKRILGGPLW